MGDVKLNSSGGGSVTLTPPSTASNYTVTLPAATSTLVDTTSTQTLTNKTLTAAGSNTVEATSGPTSTQLGGMRNKIINGAMMIDQRNAGASVTPLANVNTYTVDRWYTQQTQTSKLTVQQNAGSVTPPAGYLNYLGITSSSAYSVVSSDFFNLVQCVEGYNSADLNWGSASASSIVVSFWVRSSLTGTFSISVFNADGSRTYPTTYTISAANTWEKKTVSFSGDVTGTWGTTNTTGISLCFGLGAGSSFTAAPNSWQSSWKPQATGATSVVGTNGATFYITGVQLEKGATATPFENRLIGTELALCQRYYQKSYNVGVVPGTSTYSGIYMMRASSTNAFMIDLNHPFRVSMRANPTMTGYTAGGTAGSVTINAGSSTISVLHDAGENTTGYPQVASGPSVDADCRWHWTASAEL